MNVQMIHHYESLSSMMTKQEWMEYDVGIEINIEENFTSKIH